MWTKYVYKWLNAYSHVCLGGDLRTFLIRNARALVSRHSERREDLSLQLSVPVTPSSCNGRSSVRKRESNFGEALQGAQI